MHSEKARTLSIITTNPLKKAPVWLQQNCSNCCRASSVSLLFRSIHIAISLSEMYLFFRLLDSIKLWLLGLYLICQDCKWCFVPQLCSSSRMFTCLWWCWNWVRHNSSFHFRFQQVNNAIYFLEQKIYITGLEKNLKFQLVLWASRSYICLSRVTSCSS